MQIAQGVIPLQKPSLNEILNDFHLMKRHRWHLPRRQAQQAGLVRGNEWHLVDHLTLIIVDVSSFRMTLILRVISNDY